MLKILPPSFDLKKAAKIVFILIFFFLIFIFLNYEKKQIGYATDEISWFFHTEFFDTFFIKKDFNSDSWYSFEALDHPPFAKYVYGLELYLTNKNYSKDRQMLESKYGRWYFYDTIDTPGVKNTPFVYYINIMRNSNVVMILLILVLLFVIHSKFSKKWLLSLVFVMFLAFDNIFINTLMRATADPYYLFFTFLGVFCYLQYLKSRSALMLFAFGISLGLAVTSKITGFLLPGAYCIYKLIEYLSLKKKNVKDLAVEMIIVVGISFTVWFVLNPSVHKSPLGDTFSFFSFRSIEERRVQRDYSAGALNNLNERFNAIFNVMISHEKSSEFLNSNLFKSIFLNIITILLGVYYFLTGFKHNKKTVGFMGIFIGFFMAVVCLYLPFNWDRYYLPIVIFTFFLQFLGIGYLLDLIVLGLGRISIVNKIWHIEKEYITKNIFKVYNKN